MDLRSILNREHLPSFLISRSTWAAFDNADPGGAMTLSFSLGQSCVRVGELFKFFGSLLAPPILHKLHRHFAESVTGAYWNRIITKNRFSFHGSRQLYKDVCQISAILEDGRMTSNSLLHLEETTALLSIPSDGDSISGSHTLVETSKRIFESDANATRLLKEMQLLTVSVMEARQILRRRLEVGM